MITSVHLQSDVLSVPWAKNSVLVALQPMTFTLKYLLWEGGGYSILPQM